VWREQPEGQGGTAPEHEPPASVLPCPAPGATTELLCLREVTDWSDARLPVSDGDGVERSGRGTSQPANRACDVPRPVGSRRQNESGRSCTIQVKEK